jgi:hypothetical protein
MASLLSLIILIITIFESLIWYFTYFTLIGFHCWICDYWKGHISLFFPITYVSVLGFMHLKLSLIGVLNLPSSVISVEVLRILRQGWVVARLYYIFSTLDCGCASAVQMSQLQEEFSVIWNACWQMY